MRRKNLVTKGKRYYRSEWENEVECVGWLEESTLSRLFFSILFCETGKTDAVSIFLQFRTG